MGGGALSLSEEHWQRAWSPPHAPWPAVGGPGRPDHAEADASTSPPSARVTMARTSLYRPGSRQRTAATAPAVSRGRADALPGEQQHRHPPRQWQRRGEPDRRRRSGLRSAVFSSGVGSAPRPRAKQPLPCGAGTVARCNRGSAGVASRRPLLVTGARTKRARTRSVAAGQPHLMGAQPAQKSTKSLGSSVNTPAGRYRPWLSSPVTGLRRRIRTARPAGGT